MSDLRRGPYERLIDDVHGAGATLPTARAIVETLRGAGLRVGDVRAWLLNSNRGYPLWTPRWAWQQPAVHAIDDGYEDLVLQAARRFAAAPADERAVARAVGCDVESAYRLTGGDAGRAATMAEIVRNLHKTLTDAQMRDSFFVEDRERDGRRLLDDLFEGHELALLQRVRQREFDPRQLLDRGMLRLSYVPGGHESNPYLAQGE